jgi:hypothetical protein
MSVTAPPLCIHETVVMLRSRSPFGTKAKPTYRLGVGSTSYVRLWHKADVQTALMDVRFEGNNGHDADMTRCLLMTQSGHSRRAMLIPVITAP